MGSHLWSIVVIAGPVILVAAILWAMLNNRTTKRQDRQTEEATRRLYKEGTTDESVNTRT